MDNNQIKLIGTRLKKLRKQVGLSRKKISEIYNFPENTIKTWEAGETEIGVIRLSKYLEIFHNFGFYIDLNSIISVSVSETETPTLVQPNEVNDRLQNLSETNTMFHSLANGLVVYFNPKYEFFLSDVKTKSIMPMYLEHIFNDDCNTILPNTEQRTRVINLNKTLSNVTINLTLKLYANIDSYKRLISLTGFVLT